ncbi:type 1 glutamine amidotransferase [Sneathiella sp.]|jgi:GMP synthase-like glutamine amidotransferase|uniref:type 1 glutamine amidotransferase n=1 Tax=Sneathiella sp. TaxID=1964365 RepID=UPI0039E70BDA
MKKTVGILRTGYIGGSLGADHGEYPEMFITMLGENRFDYRTYSVVDGEFPDAPTDCDAWIITGSKHGVYEDHAWIPPLEDFIRQLAASQQPTVGICFGHQIMAQALGGKVEKSTRGWGIGPHEYVNVRSGETVKLLAFHQDQVVELPPGAEITHRSDFCPFAGLQYSETCYSLQPHPEHTPDFVADLISERRRTVLPDDLAEQALSRLLDPNHQDEYGRKISASLDK